MKVCLNHVAINVTDYEWYKNFFLIICEMNPYREDAAKENMGRKIWFIEGIQINEVEEEMLPQAALDHIGLHSPDVVAFVAQAIEAGCLPHPSHKKKHWFLLPNGVHVEVKTYE